ncbi:MAG: hypothetical protein U0768_13160 [Anaerolineae bacterium]
MIMWTRGPMTCPSLPRASLAYPAHPGRKARAAMCLAAQNWPHPLLIGEDAIHGHSFWKGATIFPTWLALACSWNPEPCWSGWDG